MVSGTKQMLKKYSQTEPWDESGAEGSLVGRGVPPPLCRELLVRAYWHTWQAGGGLAGSGPPSPQCPGDHSLRKIPDCSGTHRPAHQGQAHACQHHHPTIPAKRLDAGSQLQSEATSFTSG